MLAFYAVKATTNSDDPQQVATITDEKKELLGDLFRQANGTSSYTAKFQQHGQRVVNTEELTPGMITFNFLYTIETIAISRYSMEVGIHNFYSLFSKLSAVFSCEHIDKYDKDC